MFNLKIQENMLYFITFSQNFIVSGIIKSFLPLSNILLYKYNFKEKFKASMLKFYNFSTFFVLVILFVHVVDNVRYSSIMVCDFINVAVTLIIM